MQDDIVLTQHMMQGLAALQRIAEIQYQYNPRKMVYHHHKVKLYHYEAKIKKSDTTPLLVVFATVNRPEILDLFPENSFINGLLENGSDVYFLDWGYPTSKDKHISLSDYVTEYLHDCIQFIKTNNQLEKINLLGICQGGLICLCYAALFADTKNLVLISAPIDFNTKDNLVAKLLKRIDIDLLVGLMGNVSGRWLTQFFISLRPFELIGKKYLRFVDNIEDQSLTARFLQVEKWLHDAPDQTGASFMELINDFYKKNKLIKNQISMNGKKVDLANVTMPVLNVMASQDEIVPVSASKALKKYVGTQDYTEKLYPSGHIGIYVSDKVGGAMPKEIADWLYQRE